MRTLLGRPFASWITGGTTLLVSLFVWVLVDRGTALAIFCLGIGIAILLSRKSRVSS
ncbi:MAG: hypothetical protein WCT27_02010 [Patescibacteria group bacterium]|jgi:hypothetical protein